MLCQMVVGPQFQNVMSYCNVAFSLSVGPQKMLTVTLKLANHFFTFLKVAPETNKISLACLKEKTEEKLKNIVFFLVQLNNRGFVHFWNKKKNTKQILSRLLFFDV